MNQPRSELVKGTLDLLILTALAREPMHGWGICQRIEDMSRDVLSVSQGSLYPALARLGRKGHIRDKWRTTENNRRARYYSITPSGSGQLERDRGHWQRASTAVNWVIAWTPEETT